MRKYNGSGHGPIGAAVLLLALLAGCASTPPEPAAPPAPTPPAQAEPQAPEAEHEPSAPAVRTRVQAPYRYVVKPGDTLWDIANHFLLDPWQWPEVWVVNPKVSNPHLIYPGDVLYLYVRDGRPQIARALKVERVSPQIRELPLDQAIPAIGLDVLQTFLRGPRLLEPGDFEQAPYIVEFTREHLIAGSNSGVYAVKVPDDGTFTWAIVRRGQHYVDPDTGAMLGYEAIPVGTAELRRRDGVVTTLWITQSHREVRIGDRLVPVRDDEYPARFFPHAPAQPVGGRIISVFDGVAQIGQFQIVAINRGALHGLEPGHVLGVYQSGRRARDPYGARSIPLPDEFAGTVLVYKVHPRLSYALVMEVDRAIHVLDRVDRPRRSASGD